MRLRTTNVERRRKSKADGSTLALALAGLVLWQGVIATSAQDAAGAEIARLHGLVSPLEYDRSGAPEHARRLAIAYAEGRHVSRDPIAACAFAQRAYVVTLQSVKPPLDLLKYEASLAEADRFLRSHCDGLAGDARAAAASFGCPAVGMPEEILILDSTLIRVGRLGVYPADIPENRRPGPFGCFQIVSRVRPVTVMAPGAVNGPLRPRHLIEVFAWAGGQPFFGLTWYVLELVGGDITPVIMDQDLLRSSSWPSGELPLHTSYEMRRDGSMRWRVEGAVEKQGTVDPLPAKQ